MGHRLLEFFLKTIETIGTILKMPFFFKSAKQELSPLSLFFLKLMVPLHTIKIYRPPRIYVFDIVLLLLCQSDKVESEGEDR